MLTRRPMWAMEGKTIPLIEFTVVTVENDKLTLSLYSTLPAGKLIQFKGTDLLTIDLASKKVMNATTSADLLNYYRALDYDLGVWSEKA